jgi:hypothetical protein
MPSLGQYNPNKHKGNGNYQPNGNKRARIEAQNAVTDKGQTNSTSVNNSLHGQLIALHVDDSLIDVVDNEYNNDFKMNKYNSSSLYDWLADTSTTSHITH